jgi:hypothetical protein
MIDVEAGRFTIGVFEDVAWARNALEAFEQAQFPPESLTIIAKASAEAIALVERACGVAGARLELPGIGAVVAHGSLLEALQGSRRDLGTLGLAATLRRAGFQTHDGRIFEALTGRGGVLVAVRSEPRAADALALFFSYGGGNAAIGAWTGRV